MTSAKTPRLGVNIDHVATVRNARGGSYPDPFAAALLASLGHEVEEVTDPPWTVPGMLELFTASFGPAVSTQIAFAAMLAGREPVEEDMEALSWAIWQVSQGINSVQAQMAAAQLQGFARQMVTRLPELVR